ncbi:MAG TPA: hypothetical protein VNH18_11445 [Bryobacteraceae bacterium]|nr:hypothetical protein [Bryobacteraceae bacterium]
MLENANTLTPEEQNEEQKARRAAISRANGAKSRGPVTNMGKSISARNNTRHGFLARTVVLPSESADRFHRILAGLRDHYRPANVTEHHLVDCMAVAQWRKLRVWGIENGIIGFEVKQRLASVPEVAGEDDTTQASVCLRDFTDNSAFLERINRWEGRYDRQFDRALTRLLALRQGGTQ